MLYMKHIGIDGWSISAWKLKKTRLFFFGTSIIPIPCQIAGGYTASPPENDGLELHGPWFLQVRQPSYIPENGWIFSSKMEAKWKVWIFSLATKMEAAKFRCHGPCFPGDGSSPGLLGV